MTRQEAIDRQQIIVDEFAKRISNLEREGGSTDMLKAYKLIYNYELRYLQIIKSSDDD